MPEVAAPRLIVAWAIPFVPVSPNKLRGQHWAVINKHRRQWGEITSAICGRPKFAAARKRRLEITTLRERRLDPDNETASLKPFIDSMKSLGWLKNDSNRWLDLVVTQEIGLPGLRVRLLEDSCYD